MLAPALAVLLLLAVPEVRLERWPDGTPRAEYEVRVEADGSEVRHGPWRSWHENGKDFEQGAYVDGARDGAWVVRWPNGKRRELGDYAAGLRVGAWKHYHESGPKAAEGSYRAGRRDGPWTFWGEDRSVDERRSGTYASASRTFGRCDVTVEGTTVDGRALGLWTWRRADGSLRFAGAYGPDGPEGPWVAAFADGSLDLDGQCGEYAAGVRTGPLAGWPEGLENMPRDLEPDPRRATPLALDAAVAARFEAWLAAEEGAREGPLRALAEDPQGAFVACVAFLQQVDFVAPDERARRVALEALPRLIGVPFPLEQGARAALVWRDHVEFDPLDGVAWKGLFDPHWRVGPVELAHTPLGAPAEPLGWRLSVIVPPADRSHATVRAKRAGVVRSRGGSGTEDAVENGLGWLVRAQAEDGSWERGTPRTLEATAWALLAFSGDGFGVYDPAPTQQAAARGIAWLIRSQGPHDHLYATPLCRELRSHALATWAAAELSYFEALPSLRTSVARAAAALVDAQLSDGSFPRDVATREGDVFTTVYAAMALAALHERGVIGALEPFQRALGWLADRCGRDGSLAEPEQRTPAATAATAFLRTADGKDPDRDTQLGRQVGWMVAHPSSIEPRHPQLDAEYLMFGAWTSFQVGGDVWTNWNKNMKIQLVQVQKREGEPAGSWEPLGIGPMDVTTVTAQRVLTFQAYYRYKKTGR